MLVPPPTISIPLRKENTLKTLGKNPTGNRKPAKAGRQKKKGFVSSLFNALVQAQNRLPQLVDQPSDAVLWLRSSTKASTHTHTYAREPSCTRTCVTQRDRGAVCLPSWSVCCRSRFDNISPQTERKRGRTDGWARVQKTSKDHLRWEGSKGRVVGLA